MPKFYGNLAGMNVLDLTRFAEIVKSRREALGLSQDELADAGGPSTTTMTKIENAQHAPSRITLRKLDKGLGWQPGSARRALDGGDPVTIAQDAPRPRWESVSTEELLEMQASLQERQASIQAELQQRYHDLRGTPERGRRRNDGGLRGARDNPDASAL